MMTEDIMSLDWQGAADYVEPRVGSRQVLLSELREAQKLICLRLTTKFDTVTLPYPYLKPSPSLSP